MTAQEGVSCEVCRKQRAPGEIHPRQSKVLPNMTILICSKCESERKEPRAFIILAAKSRGLGYVKTYVKERRYEGEEILLKSILD